MPELDFLKELLSTGADGALIAVALALWKLDRRVVRIETIIGKAVKDGVA
ncbi:MAG: hypothetical protein WCY02_01700 [Parvibaculum sp.]